MTKIFALATLLATLLLPAQALPVLVNNVSCPAASVRFGSTGMLADLPAGCSSNGNPCEGATATISLTELLVQAPPACLASSVTPSSTIARGVTLNGIVCSDATATFKADEIALDAPTACQAAALIALEPQIGGSAGGLRAVTFSGRACNAGTVTFSQGLMEITAPHACLDGGPPPPTITSINPASAYTGQQVTLVGSNFAANATVTIGGVAAAVQGAATATTLVVLVPVVALGAQPVIVTVDGISSAASPMMIIASPITLLSVQSRKTHGAAGTFSIDIDNSQNANGPVTVEPRTRGAGHVIVFGFSSVVISPGTISAVDSLGNAVAFQSVFQDQEVSVLLTDVSDNQRVTINLLGVNGTSQTAATIGFLVGDVNGSRSVNATDIAGIKGRSGLAVDASNFQFDVNASGGINATDISAVKVRSGLLLP
jgi:IPT/TIG domain/Dockerin type I domain